MLKKGGLTALLLFGMFFGAGNLTFPPQLGFESGGRFWPAIAGFVLSGVGIAILTLIIGTLNPKGYIHEISQKISPKFALVYLAVLYLSIGPFFAIPRTAAAAFSIGFSPLIGSGHTNLWLLAFTVIYFALALWIAMNPSKILDSIGRILTPIFAIMIVIVIVAGALKYGGHSPQLASQAYQASAFGKGFLEGYNTLDALASVAFSVVAVVTLNQLGFKSKKEYISTIWVVGFVVTLLFGISLFGKSFPTPSGRTTKRCQYWCQCLVTSHTSYLWTSGSDFPSYHGDSDLFHNNRRTYCCDWGILPQGISESILQGLLYSLYLDWVCDCQLGT